ncbi:putative uracil-DNA glycosylase [Cyclospora cayetanensis]|uniref:Uracil-DNA glycosylase n=1 Tax=Cyclospora cayetanensis TaxID=88456 RepID=A0A1D3D8X7_9EIME|nr:putative uracil-DNA glycosylase [Cyclospora cayetanensis]
MSRKRQSTLSDFFAAVKAPRTVGVEVSPNGGAPKKLTHGGADGDAGIACAVAVKIAGIPQAAAAAPEGAASTQARQAARTGSAAAAAGPLAAIKSSTGGVVCPTGQFVSFDAAEKMWREAMGDSWLEKVRVVIVGQDPYHQPGQAMARIVLFCRPWRAPPPKPPQYFQGDRLQPAGVFELAAAARRSHFLGVSGCFSAQRDPHRMGKVYRQSAVGGQFKTFGGHLSSLG